jgi:hypothetical protein
MAQHTPPRPRREPLFDFHPQTGISIEVFYSDRTLETFGRGGAAWFWQTRRRGYPPEGHATGPFATSYAAYRHAMNTARVSSWRRASITQRMARQYQTGRAASDRGSHATLLEP